MLILSNLYNKDIEESYKYNVYGTFLFTKRRGIAYDELIRQFPYMGADLVKRVTFRTDYKYVVCGNYVVLYKIGYEYIEIYRVVNRYQDITKIF